MTARDGSASYFAELSRDLFGAPQEETTTDAVVRRALEVVRFLASCERDHAPERGHPDDRLHVRPGDRLRPAPVRAG